MDVCDSVRLLYLLTYLLCAANTRDGGRREVTHSLGRYQVSESASVTRDTQLPCKFRVASPSVDASLTTTCRPRAASITPQRLAIQDGEVRR